MRLTNYTVTNIGTVAGWAGHRQADLHLHLRSGGVWTSNWSEDANGSYGGYFNGTGGNDGNFSGIEQFEFIDNGGGDTSSARASTTTPCVAGAATTI